MGAEKTMRVVSLADPSVDVEAMGEDLRDYLTRREETLVKVLPGQRAQWFEVRRLASSVFQTYVAEASTDAQRYERAFRVGVVRVVELVRPDGTVCSVPWEPSGSLRIRGTDRPFMTDEELDLFPPAYVEEIGSIVHGLSFLPPQSAVRWQPPPWCLQALAARTVQAAAELRRAASKATSAPQSSSTTSEPASP